jgi:hypothetical protein
MKVLLMGYACSDPVCKQNRFEGFYYATQTTFALNVAFIGNPAEVKKKQKPHHKTVQTNKLTLCFNQHSIF